MSRTRFVASLLFCLVPSVGLPAADLTRAQALQLGKDFGEANKSDVSDVAANADLTTVPGFEGTDVPATQYYGAGLGIEDAARQALPNSEVGRYVQEAALSRPRFNIDRTDPVVQRGDAIAADPEASLGRQLAGQYSGCEEVTAATSPSTFSEERCTEWGLTQDLTCQRALEITVTQQPGCTKGHHLTRVIADPCPSCIDYLAFDFSCGSGHYVMHVFTILKRNGSLFMDAGTQTVPGGLNVTVPMTQGPSRVDRSYCYRTYYSQSCSGAKCTIGAWFTNPCLDVSYYGQNTFVMPTRAAIGGESWRNGCASLKRNADCQLISDSCVAPNETRVINGLSVHRPCWRFQATYRCASNKTREEPYCRELRDRGCSQVSSVCTERTTGGRCRGYEQTYRCPQEERREQTVLNCGNQVFCLQGDCFDAGYEPNRDFGLAASHLGAIEAAAKDFDTTRMIIFKGKRLKCKKTKLGFSNCCKNTGWGIDLSLARCSAREKMLGEKRQIGQCRYVGDYCSEDTVFGCVARKYTYCCFNSKLARIIQEQGRAQLGIAWGSAKHPNCGGFTPEALTRIDFARIDFTAFYAEAFASAGHVDRPAGNQLQQIIEQRLRRRLP